MLPLDKLLLVFALGATSLWCFAPTVKLHLQKLKSRLIARFVGGKIQLLFQQKGGNMELGEFKFRDGSTAPYFKNAPKHLGEWFALGKRHAKDDHIVYYGAQGKPATRESFEHVMARAESLSRSLRAAPFSLSRGARVSILMSNTPEYGVSFMGVTRIQLIAVTLNAFWEEKEIEFGLLDSQSELLIVDERRFARLSRNTLEALFDKLSLKVILLRPTTEHSLAMLKEFPDRVFDFDSICNANTPATYEYEDIDPETDAYIVYTSGTTSPTPKGVVHTHVSTVNTTMCFQLFVELVRTLSPKSASGALRRSDLVTGPMFHSATLNPVFLLSFYDGHKLVMIPKWETDAALKICLEEKITFFGAMPTLLQDILKSPYFQANIGNFSFTNIGTGGASVPSELIRRVSQALPSVTQGSGWGLTESNAVGTIIGGPDYLAFPESCGKAHPIVKLKLVNPETLEESTTGEGELLIHSITNMRGYWNNEKDTKEVLLRGNWIRTGDYGRIDSDGFVFIIDRLKEIVIRGGENISTNEVESVIYSYSADSISEVVCFGLPHERLGEQLCAAIVPVKGHEIDADAIKQHCDRNLAKFKVPSLVFVRDAANPLPRSATNKILKRKLREEYKNVAA